MTERFSAEEILRSLKPFQRDTVEHVFSQFYGEGAAGGTHRFLVSDETGLGKSIVARGVVAKTIEHLSSPDHTIPRIDIVYICSNQDLAKQNLARLNVGEDDNVTLSTRLSLLAKENHNLNGAPTHGRSRINLVAFTPGTSFSEGGWRQGNVHERALLVFFLDLISNGSDKRKRRATRRLLTGAVSSTERFTEIAKQLNKGLEDNYDAHVEQHFRQIITDQGILQRFEKRRDELAAQRHPKKWMDSHKNDVHDLIAQLRSALSKAGVEALEPDLIILDEFQRFKHLLDPNSSEAAALAHSLFEYKDVRVLLLSATPYKPYTQLGDSEDDHLKDFLATIKFLMTKPSAPAADATSTELSDPTRPLQHALRAYRDSMGRSDIMSEHAADIRRLLLPVMSRAERPPLTAESDFVDVEDLGSQLPTAEDISGWVAMSKLGRAAGAPMSIDYWKSIPYFANFMDGYVIASRLSEALRTAKGRRKLAEVFDGISGLNPEDISRFAPLELRNGHLRALAERTVDNDWWKLLWVPPSMPYLKPGRIFGKFSDGSVTKQIVFSAWSAVPTAVASLLSYEATRRAAGDLSVHKQNDPESRKAVGQRLQYRLSDDRASAMSTLALFWPHPGLATRADELGVARNRKDVVSARDFARQFGTARVRSNRQPWNSFFTTPGLLPAALSDQTNEQLALAFRLPSDKAQDDEDYAGSTTSLATHIAEARSLREEQTAESRPVDSITAKLAAFSPANIALRSLFALPVESEIGDEEIWTGAARIAEGFRTLFNRPETVALLSQLYDDGSAYWRKVLAYCADGNLRSVLDEYLFQLHSDIGFKPIGRNHLSSMVETIVNALSLKAAKYSARTADIERREIPFHSGFAARYGTAVAHDDESSTARVSEVRTAFNSPFAPFVLVSTSVGQEGIDFHWWSHSVVHWNLPSNPVDFEQREGRVNRFGGHAVRKNIAEHHWSDVLKGTQPSAWRSASDAAEAREDGLGDFSPWWMYQGSSKINRLIAQYPLSSDRNRYKRLSETLRDYRLTLGQPRQEDMLELIRRRGLDGSTMPTIDLSAPTSPTD